MTNHEAKRIRRKHRLNKPVRMSKKRASQRGVTGQRPIKGKRRIRNNNKSTELPARVKVPKKFSALFKPNPLERIRISTAGLKLPSI